MTKSQFIKKFRQMRKEHNQAILKEAVRLFECGGIDPTKYEDDFLLPRIIMRVALFNEAWQYKPHGQADEKAVKNLSHY